MILYNIKDVTLMKRNNNLLDNAFPVFVEILIPGLFIDENFSSFSKLLKVKYL